MRAHDVSHPDSIAATPEDRPATCAGSCTKGRSFPPRPLPSSPSKLLPQHLTPPSVVSAQTWPLPAAISATPPCKPITSTGERRVVVVPSPSCPASLEPQHFAA